MKRMLLFFCLFLVQLSAHEGHEHADLTSWTQWVGSFHLVLLHFPIALINLLAFAELMFLKTQKPMYQFSSDFLLKAAVWLTPPTALLGLIFSYSSSYTGLMEWLLLAHMWSGFMTTAFIIGLYLTKKFCGVGNLYYIFLMLLFLLINITGFLGGSMTFSPL